MLKNLNEYEYHEIGQEAPKPEGPSTAGKADSIPHADEQYAIITLDSTDAEDELYHTEFYNNASVAKHVYDSMELPEGNKWLVKVMESVENYIG